MVDKHSIDNEQTQLALNETGQGFENIRLEYKYKIKRILEKSAILDRPYNRKDYTLSSAYLVLISTLGESIRYRGSQIHFDNVNAAVVYSDPNIGRYPDIYSQEEGKFKDAIIFKYHHNLEDLDDIPNTVTESSFLVFKKDMPEELHPRFDKLRGALATIDNKVDFVYSPEGN